MQSKATTVQAYLKELPAERRATVERVRDFVNRTIAHDDGVEEGMQYGMICWYIPHRVYPPGYHVNPRIPLGYLALASQKNYLSLYINTVYGEGGDTERWFRSAWERRGKKLDMGKSCIRFKRVDDLALDVIAEAIGKVDSRETIRIYEAARAGMEARGAARGTSRKSTARPAKATKKPLTPSAKKRTAPKSGEGDRAARASTKRAAKKR